MAKSQLVMLAHPYKPSKHGIGGWYASEKLDGQRAIWLPGTRGLMKADVPFANTAKDHIRVTPPVATGLWTRLGNVIHAPAWWLAQLPAIPLDGELWLRRGRGAHQELSSIIRRHLPDDEDWEGVKYACFDMPSIETLLGDRRINITNYSKTLDGCVEWWEGLGIELDYRPKPQTQFITTYELLKKWLKGNEVAFCLKQTQLSFQTTLAKSEAQVMLDVIEERGGEGLILRNPFSVWIPERTHNLVKVKPVDDDEGTVIGYVSGRETDKGSKFLGLMGALILEYNGQRLELSGFTDAERSLNSIEATAWAAQHPGKELPDWASAKQFPRGSSVTFKYRELSRDGVPKEARYYRKRVTE